MEDPNPQDKIEVDDWDDVEKLGNAEEWDEAVSWEHADDWDDDTAEEQENMPENEQQG
jgi:hypothetical protein